MSFGAPRKRRRAYARRNALATLPPRSLNGKSGATKKPAKCIERKRRLD
jgi:hypothetical protein